MFCNIFSCVALLAGRGVYSASQSTERWCCGSQVWWSVLDDTTHPDQKGKWETQLQARRTPSAGKPIRSISSQAILGALMHTYVLSSVCLQLACCSVSQFSWFVAVSRPFLDSCSVSPDGALLVSQFDPGIKLTFPPECTTETRIVTMQVCTWMYYAVCVINLY